MPTGIGQKHSNVAVLNATCRATILARHAHRMLAVFEKPCLIKDQDRLRIPKVLHQISAQLIPDGLGIPPGTPQQMLHTIGRRITVDFR
jgi:hypothetical protein